MSFESRDGVSEGVEEGIVGSSGGFSEDRREPFGFAQGSLGECFLDGIEIGAVGREVAQGGAGGLDCLSNAVDLVGRQIVHDDDVVGSEGRNEELSDPGPEAFAVDQSIEDAEYDLPMSASGLL